MRSQSKTTPAVARPAFPGRGAPAVCAVIIALAFAAAHARAAEPYPDAGQSALVNRELATGGLPSTPTLLMGYYPEDDFGTGHAYFVDYAPPAFLGSYLLQVRRTNYSAGTPFFTHVFNITPLVDFDGASAALPPPLAQTGDVVFQLPLNDDKEAYSWEVDLQFRLIGYTLPDAKGSVIFKSFLAYAKHPSAAIINAGFGEAVIDRVGFYEYSFTDYRATAQINTYLYDLIRFGPPYLDPAGTPSEAIWYQFNHGFGGPADVEYVWGSIGNLGLYVPFELTTQSYRVAPRADFYDSGGGHLGRYNIAPGSPAYQVRLQPLGRPGGDFDSSGCTDINDFLYLLDNWQNPLLDPPLGLVELLALLDNWQAGPAC